MLFSSCRWSDSSNQIMPFRIYIYMCCRLLSPPQLSMSSPTTVYLAAKWPCQPAIFSLHGQRVQHVILGGSNTYISEDVRSDRSSKGLLTSVSMSVISTDHPAPSAKGLPSSKDCFAMPREASRPAKLPYMPSIPISSGVS
jgi:hypothetical protein